MPITLAQHPYKAQSSLSPKTLVNQNTVFYKRNEMNKRMMYKTKIIFFYVYRNVNNDLYT